MTPELPNNPRDQLEARLTDSSGLVPNSQAWLDYWHVKAARILDGQDPDKIPINISMP